MSANRCGVSYKGSKNKIADRLWQAIPTQGVENFYDLFAGGCVMTHRALESDAPAGTSPTTGKVTERLFVPRHQLQKYHDMIHDGKRPHYVQLELFPEYAVNE